MQAKPAFKGVFVPAEILQNAKLTCREKILLAYIQGLPKFFASDRHIAETLGWPKKTVSNAIIKLRKKVKIERGRYPNQGIKGQKKASDIPESGYQTYPNQGMPIPQSGYVSIGREESLELSKKKVLEESNQYPNQGKDEPMNPNPPEQPLKPPPEIRPPQPTYDPYDVPFGEPVFERKEMSFEAFCDNEDLKAKSQPWKRINP